MLPPLVHTVNYDGLTPSSQPILRGQFDNPSLSPHTKIHLTELAIPSGLPPWPSQLLDISKEEHATSWRKAKEFTSSSPSGLHFGLWKANATHDHLCELDAIMRAIPFRTGHALQRWLQGTDVELQKEPNNWNIERLRTIVLIEADHNMNNKLLGRRTMSHGEAHHALAPEQHGSRKRLSAIQASVNNRLMYDIMRQHRHGGILCSNDAKSCYDRIVHSVLSLSLQRLGFHQDPSNPCFTLSSTCNTASNPRTVSPITRTQVCPLFLLSKASSKAMARPPPGGVPPALPLSTPFAKLASGSTTILPSHANTLPLLVQRLSTIPIFGLLLFLPLIPPPNPSKEPNTCLISGTDSYTLLAVHWLPKRVTGTT